ncbi:MAG: ester cyclase [Pyrinomonadaceae bacterium]
MKQCIIVFSLLFSIFASRPTTAIATEGGPADVFRSCINMWETGDVTRFNDLIADSYVGHVSSGTRERSGLLARIAAFHKLYPDIHFYIEDQFTKGERVVTRMRAVGTNSSSGAKTELMGINISRIVKNKLVEEWATWEPISAK